MATETEKTLTELKEILSSLIDIKKASEETGKSIEDIKKELETVKGSVDELDKNQKIAGKRVSDIKSTDFSKETKLDLAKFFVGVYKKDEAKVKEVQDKFGIKSMNEGTGSAGGYAVPEQFSNEVLKLASEKSIILTDARFVPLTAGYKLPVLSSINNVSVSWVNEAADAVNADVTLSKSSIPASKMLTETKLSNELLEDESVGLVDLIVSFISDAFAQEIDNQGFNGNGSPFTGVLNAAGVNSVSSGAGFDNVTFDELEEAIAKLSASNRIGAKFYLHRTILSVLKQLKDSNGNYIYSPAANGAPSTIWGYPYAEVEAMPDLSASASTTPFIAFGNLKNVQYGTRGNMAVSINKSLYEKSDESAIYVKQRIAIAVGLPQGLVKIETV